MLVVRVAGGVGRAHDEHVVAGRERAEAFGDAQAPKRRGGAVGPSSRHSPCRVAVNANAGDGSVVGPVGPGDDLRRGRRREVDGERPRGGRRRRALPGGVDARGPRTCARRRPAPAVVNGVAHAVNAAPSSEHSKRLPASSELKVNVGVASLIAPAGPDRSSCRARAVSTDERARRGRRRRGCRRRRSRGPRRCACPSRAAPCVCGDGARRRTRAPSTRHWNVARLRRGERERRRLIAGRRRIAVSVVSARRCRRSRTAARACRRVAGGVDRADLERVRALRRAGVARRGRRRRRRRRAALEGHCRLSLEVKVKAAVVEFTGPLGPPVIVVSGALVSTVQVRVAGALVLPAASTARTWKRVRALRRARCSSPGRREGGAVERALERRRRLRRS